MSDVYIGQVILTGWNFAARNFASTEGQLLAISSNSALFSLLGTTFGGDGRTSFGLPDLRGRTPFMYGTGPGLTNFRWG
ncbi:MAG: tail fiber protein, partial [Litorimonas sp.]